MRLINEFIFDEEEYFSELLKEEDNKEEILNSLGDLHTVVVKYFKDDHGNLYTRYYFDGEKVNSNDLNGYYKEHIYKFESESRVLFQ